MPKLQLVSLFCSYLWESFLFVIMVTNANDENDPTKDKHYRLKFG